MIDRAGVKHAKKNQNISKFTQKRYAFVYACLIDFASCNIAYDTIITTNFFQNVSQVVKVKAHLHHPYVTGKILGYAHDFCYWRLPENKEEFVYFAHTFFGFGMHFLKKGFNATVWNTKDFKIGGSGLTRINFANSSSTTFIDMLKYYQKTLLQLTKTVTNYKWIVYE